MHRVILVSKDTVPNAEHATRLVARAFPDMEVFNTGNRVIENEECWCFRLRPSTGMIAYDAELPDNLKRQYGITLHRMFNWSSLKRRGGILWFETFQHSWSLLAWSYWLASANGSLQPPTLLRFDSHDDLGSSLLLATDNPWKFAALFGDIELDLRDPPSIRRSLKYGLVGIGSFILPFLWGVNNVRVFHGVPPTGGSITERDRWLISTPLFSGCDYGLVSHARSHPADNYRFAGYKYCRFESISTVTIEPKAPLLLDIDLDYFSLVSSRAGVAPTAATLDTTLEAIDRFGQELAAAGLKKPDTVTIAYSPGFFPSSWWPEAIKKLRKELLNVFT